MFTEETTDSNPEAPTYFPELPGYRHGLSGHLETLWRASQAV